MVAAVVVGEAQAAYGPKDTARFREHVVSVADFGAIPDDGKDDTRALRRAVEYCRTHENATAT